MTGHHAHKRSLGANHAPAADHRLDQFAAQVAEARATQPALQALAATEQQFLDTALDIGGHLDHETVGAAWLILGQLFAANLAGVPPEQQAPHLGMLLNVARLAGQRLYTGDQLPVTVKCPFSYSGDVPCTKELTMPNIERLDTLMRAHVWQQHPGCTWPLAPDPEGRSLLCSNCESAVAVHKHAVYGPLCGACYGGFFDAAIARTEAACVTDDPEQVRRPVPDEIVIAGDGGPGTFSDATGRVWPVGAPRPRHAPHELCDCRPGETYHCAADVDGKAHG